MQLGPQAMHLPSFINEYPVKQDKQLLAREPSQSKQD